MVITYYAGALGLLFLVLSVRVIFARRRLGVGFGAVQDSDLERRVRVHANFAEYVPLTLLLIALAEFRGAPPVVIHVLGGLLLAGRLCHAVGVSRPATDNLGRIVGMAGTQTALLGAAVLCLTPKLA
ncbi:MULTISPECIES: MAPEG family protein [Caulobacter]|jgi:uncharacterized membrane protein YecN with MAPEG domain|uniref:Putative MAPEG superfamily protein n=1 Tax=Caulobacter vibrioides OR37 TaxID=1292034 RepID=R0E9T8_CAUVI|nr:MULTISPECIES: MAPEG family protein [Caulobacter]ENZ82223.1 putative MAPEG superfamily protein [Caulobacter vibrioides OR37]MBQ1562766.1 MAPEG family protein [Caulobacter sp.]